MTHATRMIIERSSSDISDLVVDVVEVTIDSLKPTLSSTLDSFHLVKKVIDVQAKQLAKANLKAMLDSLYEATCKEIDDAPLELTKVMFTANGVNKIEYLVNGTSRYS